MLRIRESEDLLKYAILFSPGNGGIGIFNVLCGKTAAAVPGDCRGFLLFPAVYFVALFLRISYFP